VAHTILLILLIGIAADAAAGQEPQPIPPPADRQLRVFLDCSTDCFSEYLRSEITFIDYVRDRAEADVHLLITRAATGSGGQEYTAHFIGTGRFAGTERSLKAITTASDSEDMIRRQLANTVRIGLLSFIAQDGVPQRLDLRVELGSEQLRPAVVGDRWNNWVFSLRGEASLDGEETTREMQLSGSVSADRITPDWKITLGAEIDHERERFNIDEADEEPLEVERRERNFNWLVVKGLGEHWSAGAMGEIESSTFTNTNLAISAAPAIEYNIFPYSQYTRRQLRILYALGPSAFDYYEETLYGKTEETLVQHELSATFDQRERWGSLEARVEWSQYLHDLDLSRLEVNGEVSLRIARGLSVLTEVNASRIRDQVSLPARGATPEEILLRLRELSSGYEYSFSFGLTYTFGSIFSSVVNPRFGQ
jgi:hypothetical protein